jgi:WXG100 family type VII secretion target
MSKFVMPSANFLNDLGQTSCPIREKAVDIETYWRYRLVIMGAPKFKADYEQLAAIARSFGEQSEAVKQTQSQLTGHLRVLQGGAWVGKAATAFFGEMNGAVMPSVGRLAEALAAAQTCVTNITTAIHQAEHDAAAVLKAPDTAPAPSATPVPVPKPTPAPSGTPMPPGGQSPAPTSGPSQPARTLWQRALDVIKGVTDAIEKLVDFTSYVVDIAIAEVRSLVTRAANYVRTNAPRWFRRITQWIPKVLRNPATWRRLFSVARKIAPYIARVLRKIPVIGYAISAIQGVIAIAQTWTKNWDEYMKMDWPKRIAAMAVDAGIAVLPAAGQVIGGLLGSTVGGWAGAQLTGVLGFLVGTVAPGAGNVIGGTAGVAIGGAIGTVVGSIIGDELGGRGGEALRDWLISSGNRDRAIDWLDRSVTRPISNGISSVTERIAPFLDPSKLRTGSPWGMLSTP